MWVFHVGTAFDGVGVRRPCIGAAGTAALCSGMACGAEVVGAGVRGSCGSNFATSCCCFGSTATSGLGAGLISGGGSSTGFDATFSSIFCSSSTCSTGLSGEASDITCSGPGAISVGGASGATGSGANSTTIAAAGSAGSMSSRQGTIPAAMAPCASTTIAALIAQRRRSASSSALTAITAFSPAPPARPSGIRPRARDSSLPSFRRTAPLCPRAGKCACPCRRLPPHRACRRADRG